MRLDRIIPRDQVTVEYGSGEDRIRVTLHTIDGAKLDRMRRSCRPVGALDSNEVGLEAWKEKLVDDVLVNVDGLEDENGPVAYNRGIGRRLVKNDRFAAWLLEQATTLENALGEGGNATARG